MARPKSRGRDIQVLYVPQEEGEEKFFERIEKLLPEEDERNLILPPDGGVDSYSDVIQLCEDELDSARRAVVILDSIQSFRLAEGRTIIPIGFTARSVSWFVTPRRKGSPSF